MLAAIIFALLLTADAFRISIVPPSFSHRSITQFSSNQKMTLYAVKPDLFSDDLFEDDENQSKGADKTRKDDSASANSSGSKKKYLDEKWKLSVEDSKDFKGFPNKNKSKPDIDFDPSKALPVFALMYRLRREYLEANIEAILADHKGHVAKFKNILNSEVINLGKAKGVVILWVGKDNADKPAMKTEIMRFLEDDPFILKDAVENWDIIDLEKKPKQDLPEKASASTGK
eukprot:gene8807-11890_t